MKKAIVFFIPIVLFFISCINFSIGGGVKGEGPMEKTERSVSEFKGVNLMASADVKIKQSSAFKVVVDGQKNITELLETVVENGVLKIRFKNNVGNLHYDKLIVYVEAPSFNEITLSGSGDITVENALSSSSDMQVNITGSGDLKAPSITSSNMSIEVSGSGDLEIKDAQTGKLTAGLVGSGGIHIAGKNTSSEYVVSGSGDIDGIGLMSQEVSAQITGSGNISCHADKNLDALVSGSGDVTYTGTPSVKSRVTGSGEVSAKN